MYTKEELIELEKLYKDSDENGLPMLENEEDIDWSMVDKKPEPVKGK